MTRYDVTPRQLGVWDWTAIEAWMWRMFLLELSQFDRWSRLEIE